MKEDKGKNNILRFSYLTAKDYKPEYVNGLVGSVTPKGDAVVHFYHERPPVQPATKFVLDNEGKVGEEIKIADEAEDFVMERHIVSGIILRKRDVKRMHEWFGKVLEVMEKRGLKE